MKIGKFYHLDEAALPDQLSRDITCADEKVCCNKGGFPIIALSKVACSKGLHQADLHVRCSPPACKMVRLQVLRDGHLQILARGKWSAAQGSGLHVYQFS